MKTIFVLILGLILISCDQTENKAMVSPNEKNSVTTISTDLNKLKELINIEKYKPIKAKYKHVCIKYSGPNQSQSATYPSENSIEAVLYFDSPTFNRIIEDNSKLSTITHGRKADYQFDWLDNDIKVELSKINSLRNDCPPTFFESGALSYGGYYIMDKKILLKLNSKTARNSQQ